MFWLAMVMVLTSRMMWLGDSCLVVQFFRLYSLFKNQDLFISNMGVRDRFL